MHTPLPRSGMLAPTPLRAGRMNGRSPVSEQDGVTRLAPDHPERSIADVRLLEALGSRDFDFLDGLLKQLCNVGSLGPSVDEDGLNFMLSMIKGIEPRDQVETTIAARYGDQSPGGYPAAWHGRRAIYWRLLRRRTQSSGHRHARDG
jgi:hypothetical protein